MTKIWLLILGSHRTLSSGAASMFSPLNLSVAWSYNWSSTSQSATQPELIYACKRAVYVCLYWSLSFESLRRTASEHAGFMLIGVDRKVSGADAE